MSEIVIAAYRPKPGMETALADLVRDHAPRLRALGLATERDAMVMRAGDGALVEVFEWVEGGTARAHVHPAVLAMWEEFAAACDYAPLNSLAETSQMFASFKPL